MKQLLCVVCCVMSALCWSEDAGITAGVAQMFQDGMVIQRGKPVPVWGTAPDGTTVDVTLGKDQATTTAADGKWRVDLPAREASSTPTTLALQFNDGEKTVIRDVLVGEVWICSGQSNMAGIVGKRPVKELAPMPMLRQFSKPRASDGEKYWMTCEGDNVQYFSATAVYFGEALHQKLEIPVGLLVGAVSGTPIEEWVPRDVLEADPDTLAAIEAARDRETRMKMVEVTKKLRQDGYKPTPEEEQLFELRRLSQPGRLFAINLEPLAPYGVRGMIWYQGEANSKTPANASKYGTYLGMLFKGVRDYFQVPDLPVYVVQLPSISRSRKEEDPYFYQIVRQCQLDATAADAHAGLAVNIDIHEGLHPRSKHIVGDRLAKLALAEVYGKAAEGDVCGPLLETVEFGEGKARCRFTHAAQGLELRDTEESLFELAGPDGVYHPATATLDGDVLVVTGGVSDTPTSVRYAFRPDMPQVSLYGKSGLPASPFVFPSSNR